MVSVRDALDPEVYEAKKDLSHARVRPLNAGRAGALERCAPAARSNPAADRRPGGPFSLPAEVETCASVFPRRSRSSKTASASTPGSVREAVAHGHEVIVEHNAGQGIGMDDDAYRKAGARDRRRRRARSSPPPT